MDPDKAGRRHAPSPEWLPPAPPEAPHGLNRNAFTLVRPTASMRWIRRRRQGRSSSLRCGRSTLTPAPAPPPRQARATTRTNNRNDNGLPPLRGSPTQIRSLNGIPCEECYEQPASGDTAGGTGVVLRLHRRPPGRQRPGVAAQHRHPRPSGRGCSAVCVSVRVADTGMPAALPHALSGRTWGQHWPAQCSTSLGRQSLQG